MYLDLGRDPDKAISELEEAVRLDPRNAHFNSDLGHEYLLQKKINEAIQQFRKAAEINPKYIKARANLARALAIEGKTMEAIREMAKVVELVPNRPEGHYFIGQCLADRGELGRAAGAFEHTIKCDPNFAEAHYALGMIYASQGRSGAKKAIPRFETVIKLVPNNPKPYFELGRIYHALGDTEKAIDYLVKAASINPKVLRALPEELRICDTCEMFYNSPGGCVERCHAGLSGIHLTEDYINRRIDGKLNNCRAHKPLPEEVIKYIKESRNEH